MLKRLLFIVVTLALVASVPSEARFKKSHLVVGTCLLAVIGALPWGYDKISDRIAYERWGKWDSAGSSTDLGQYSIRRVSEFETDAALMEALTTVAFHYLTEKVRLQEFSHVDAENELFVPLKFWVSEIYPDVGIRFFGPNLERFPKTYDEFLENMGELEISPFEEQINLSLKWPYVNRSSRLPRTWLFTNDNEVREYREHFIGVLAEVMFRNARYERSQGNDLQLTDLVYDHFSKFGKALSGNQFYLDWFEQNMGTSRYNTWLRERSP